MNHVTLSEKLDLRAGELSARAEVLEACAYGEQLVGLRRGSAVLRARALETLRDAYDLEERAARYRRAAARARRLASVRV